MFCPRKWLNKKSLINPHDWSLRIQLRGNHNPLPKDKWLEVPEYDEERELIYVVNDWRG